jgi:hypothetical protein
MTCSDEKLSAYLDGDLSPRARVRVEAHLSSCGRCRQALLSLGAVREALLDDRSPAPEGRDDWIRIAARLKGEPRRRGSLGLFARFAVGGPLAVAGLLAALLLYARHRPTGPSDDRIVAEAEAEFREAEQRYLHALERLRAASEHARAAWTPSRSRSYEAAAAQLEAATERCRQVTLGHPADAEAEQLLFAAYRQQIHFFQAQLIEGGGP